MPDQWDKYAEDTAQDKWSKYADDKAIDYGKSVEPSNLEKLGTGAIDTLKGIGAGVISTGVGAYDLARKVPGVDRVLPEPSPAVRSASQAPQSTAGRVGKAVEQVGEFLIPGGAINRGVKAIEGVTAGVRGAKALNVAGRAGLEGTSAAGVTALQTGGDSKEAGKAAGTAATVSTVIPPVVKAVGKVGAAVLGKTTGAGEEAIRVAATNPTPGFKKAMRGDIDEGEIVGSFREALTIVKDSRGANYRQHLAEISKQGGPPIDISPVRKQLMGKLQAFRVKVTPEGLDFSRSTIPKSEQKIVQDIAEDVIGWDDYTPLGVDALKRRISNYYSPISDVRALTSTVENSTKKVLHANVPGYSQMTQEYAKASSFIKELEQELALGPRSQQGTAIRRISYGLKQNNEYRKVLTEALDAFANSDLKGQLAGYHLKDTLPKGITGSNWGSGVTILGAIGAGALTPSAAVAMIASSPRLVGEVLTAISKLSSSGPKIAATVPKVAAAATVNRPDGRMGISGAGSDEIPSPRPLGNR